MYLAHEEAKVVAGATGRCWYYGQSATGRRPHPMLDLHGVPEWERFALTWVLVGFYAHLVSCGFSIWRLADERREMYS